jgi:chemotaxis family two-component system sensor kinase Cph1
MRQGPHDDMSIDRLFEDSSDPVYIIDPPRDRIVEANAAGCRVLEYTREELLGTPISDIHPAELPQLQAFFDAALADGANWTIALSCRTKTGKFLPTEVALYLLDTGDEVYVVGLLRDRSEHRG